jgi:hypothetical protein
VKRVMVRVWVGAMVKRVVKSVGVSHLLLDLVSIV